MKNRDGFTLVELLVVIAIIGIITTMSWPAITRVQEQNTMSKYQKYGEAMINAAKIYVDSYEEDMFYYEDDLTEAQREAGQCYYIMLQELIEHSMIKDFTQKEMTCVSDSSFVKVTRKKGVYDYEYFLGCGNKSNLDADTGKLPSTKVYFTLPTQRTLNVADPDSCTASLSEYKITYNSAGGSACSSTAAYATEGGSYTWGNLCTPRRDYYTFLGWYDTSNQLVTADTPVNGSITVKAKWRKNQVHIVYKTNGGHLMPTHDAVFTESEGTILRSGSEVSETVNYDGETTSAGLWNYNNPDWLNIGREGYHANAATAWNTEPDGSGKSYDHNKVYPASELCDASSSDCTLTVYVNWTINYAFVRQHLNGGQLTTPRHEKVSVNENSLATYNNSLNLRSIPYGSAADPWNWNNTEWLNIKRDGYICKLGEEWSQNPDGTGKTYNHSVNYTAMDYCDCTYKNCTAVIYANWIPA